MVQELHLTEQGDRRRREGHLWLRRDDVRDEACEDGAVVDLFAPDGSFRGRGFYSRESSRAVAVVSASKTDVDTDFFRQRIQQARKRRRRVLEDPRSYRVVHGTGDLLPGLVVDRYGSYLVVQLRHPALDRRRDDVVQVLEETFDPECIYARHDLPRRESFGLNTEPERLTGTKLPDRVTIQEEPYRIVADLRTGQKTGYYLDQARNRARFARYVPDGSVGVDCFSYSGAWGLAALYGGADTVTFVDQSRDALELAEENARINGWEDRVECVREDGFDYLAGRARESDHVDYVVLDPPSFADSPRKLEGARRGYGEINRRAMQLLKPGGTLATSSCTAPLSPGAFREVLDKSSRDAHALFQVFERRHQSPDHPWLTRIPATLYLTCYLGEVVLP